MDSNIYDPEAGATENTDTTLSCRRRPGRLEEVHPALLPLLRDSARQELDTKALDLPEMQTALTDEDFFEDALAPARGVILGVALSVPMWAVLGYGVYLLFR